MEGEKSIFFLPYSKLYLVLNKFKRFIKNIVFEKVIGIKIEIYNLIIKNLNQQGKKQSMIKETFTIRDRKNDHILSELVGIITKELNGGQLLDYVQSTISQEDSFEDNIGEDESQRKYNMQTDDVDVDKSKKMKSNMTIAEIYQEEEGKPINWLEVDLTQQRFIKERFELGVPLLLSQIKFAIFSIIVIFLLNADWVIFNYNPCENNTDYKCYIKQFNGGVQVYFYNPPPDYSKWISFTAWMTLSYIIRIYTKRISQKYEEYSEENDNYEIILKYFKPNLSKEQMEKIFQGKMKKYMDKINLKYEEDRFLIQFQSVTPIQNNEQKHLLMQNLIKIYSKIVQKIKEIDPIILSKNRSSFNFSLKTVSTVSFEQEYPEQQEQQQTSVIINKHIFQNEMNKDQQSNNQQEFKNDKDLQEIVQEDDFQYVERFIKKTKDEQYTFIWWKKRSLYKLLKDYVKVKKQIKIQDTSDERFSSKYIVVCKSQAQKQLLQLIVAPKRNIIRKMYEKVKYIRNESKCLTERKDVYLEQIEMSKIICHDVKWNKIGINLYDKLKRRFIMLLIGFIQLFICNILFFFLPLFKYIIVDEIETQNKALLVKILIAISISISYSLNEKIYELYSKNMAFSLKSKRIIFLMNDIFLSFAITYIFSPFIIFNLEILNIQNQTEITNDESNPLFRPVNVLVQNAVIYMSFFAIKVIPIIYYTFSQQFVYQQSLMPISRIFLKMRAFYYEKSGKYSTLSQQQIIKYFKRVKFDIYGSIIAFYNVLLVSVSLSFFNPSWLLLSIALLWIQFFVLKYQYIHVFRPTFSSIRIQIKSSQKISIYLQRTSLIAILIFIDSPESEYIIILLYFYIFCIELCVYKPLLCHYRNSTKIQPLSFEIILNNSFNPCQVVSNKTTKGKHNIGQTYNNYMSKLEVHQKFHFS